MTTEIAGRPGPGDDHVRKPSPATPAAGRSLWSKEVRPGRRCPAGRRRAAASLLALAISLLTDVVHLAEERIGPVHVLGVGVAGLAESGVLLDAAGEPCAPVIAWFDKRGERSWSRPAARAPFLPEQFSRRTGLPWDCQASLAKLLWLQSTGLTLTRGHRWSSVPEWVVHRLGGHLVREPSLASRTGLIDQATGSLWTEGLDAARDPGEPPAPAGRRRDRHRRAPLAGTCRRRSSGAALTVAGHDHPVAAIGVGAVGPDELFNSSGTADVLARSLPGVLSDDERELLVRAGLSAGAHVLPGTTLLLGGVRGGLLLRRVLGALGATRSPERDRLDLRRPRRRRAAPGPRGLRRRTHRGRRRAAPARRRHPRARLGRRHPLHGGRDRCPLATIESIVGPHRRAVASGGWTRMESVRAAKRSRHRPPRVLRPARARRRRRRPARRREPPASGTPRPRRRHPARSLPTHAVPVSSGGTP